MTKKADSKANRNNDAGVISLAYIQLQTIRDVKGKLCQTDIMEGGCISEYLDSRRLD
jgi:hypothetical protein